MLESRKRTEEEKARYMQDLKAWIEEQRDVPAEEMASFFAARLEDYEDVHMHNWGEVYRAIADYFDPGLTTLLDIGCGTGLELESMYRRFPHLQVTGVDLSRDMLRKLEGKYKDKGIRLAVADYFTYPLGDSCFDAALSFETLHHFRFEKKRGVYQKLYKALRPGGYYVECDYIACCPEEEALCQAHMDYKREKSGIPESQFIHIDTPLTLPHQLRLLEEAGFTQVRVLYENGSTAILRGERKA